MIGTLVLIVVAVLAIHAAVRASAVSPTGTRSDAAHGPASPGEDRDSGSRSVERSVDPSLENVAA
jgi:hypothetical protein